MLYAVYEEISFTIRRDIAATIRNYYCIARRSCCLFAENPKKIKITFDSKKADIDFKLSFRSVQSKMTTVSRFWFAFALSCRSVITVCCHPFLVSFQSRTAYTDFIHDPWKVILIVLLVLASLLVVVGLVVIRRQCNPYSVFPACNKKSHTMTLLCIYFSFSKICVLIFDFLFFSFTVVAIP